MFLINFIQMWFDWKFQINFDGRHEWDGIIKSKSYCSADVLWLLFLESHEGAFVTGIAIKSLNFLDTP